ncbi:MAG: hypothetical protein CSA65_07095 [Proteobacteria bacterium]|nr:MAG: hypothetical protein CSB49_05050 [Pseudomonadota bacterium]PIE17913.1 MAG: hypothetical protein CSA65_07095 [Pseudomonadota bacterium]
MAIRDLGYKKYEGTRLPPRKRYSVLTSRTLSLAWASGLVKATLIVGLLPLLVCAAIMYLKLRMQMMLAARGAPIKIEDAAAWIYYGGYWCQLWFAFAMGLLVAAPAISEDVSTGAFQFYFSRPIDRGHYATAKLVTAALLVLILIAVPTLLLSALRIGMEKENVVAQLPLLLKSLAYIGIATTVLVLPPLALSALSRKSGYAQGGWAAIFFLPWVLGEGMAAAADVPHMALISLPTCLRLVAQRLYGLTPSYDLPWYLPAGVLAALVIASIAIIDRRLAKVEVFS